MTEREFIYVLEDGRAGVSIALQLQPLERHAPAVTGRAYVPYEWSLVWTLLRMAGELAAHEEREKAPKQRLRWRS